MSIYAHNLFFNKIMGEYRAELNSLLTYAAEEIDADDVLACARSKVKSEKYLKAQGFLDQLTGSFDVVSVLVMKPVKTETGYAVMNLLSGFGEKDLEMGAVHDVPIGLRLQEAMEADGTIYIESRTEAGHRYSGLLAVRGAEGKPVAVPVADKYIDDISRTLVSYAVSMAVMSAVFGLAAVFLINGWLKKRIATPLKKLKKSAESFVESSKQTTDPTELSFEDPGIRSNDEMQALSGSVRDMVDDLKRYMSDLITVTKERERIGAELDVAAKIQADMLPRDFPVRDDFSVYASMTPAREVGGDFCDFFMVDGTHLAMVMADVSGKGVPAALFMVTSKTLIRNRTMMGGEPKDILRDVNNLLSDGNDSCMFVTVWLSILDLESGKGLTANAGHEHPALCRSGGAFELEIYKHDSMLGVMGGMKYRQREFSLGPGDCLFVYTDGVPEATDGQNQLFGTERLLEGLSSKIEVSYC